MRYCSVTVDCTLTVNVQRNAHALQLRSLGIPIEYRRLLSALADLAEPQPRHSNPKGDGLPLCTIYGVTLARTVNLRNVYIHPYHVH
jgi:hypothetical protein